MERGLDSRAVGTIIGLAVHHGIKLLSLFCGLRRYGGGGWIRGGIGAVGWALIFHLQDNFG